MTITGDVDLVEIVKKLRKVCSSHDFAVFRQKRGGGSQRLCYLLILI